MGDRDNPSPHRAERYRLFARIALARAQQASSPELRDAFARLSDGWNQLADQVESNGRGREF